MRGLTLGASHMTTPLPHSANVGTMVRELEAALAKHREQKSSLVEVAIGVAVMCLGLWVLVIRGESESEDEEVLH